MLILTNQQYFETLIFTCPILISSYSANKLCKSE